ncbi:MAG: acetate--CoA ligase family protein [Verrucomicrobiaceae bacterium]|nr:acetate--CoA ligase family protein [Verrucomicrobiaceae bacterium]
MSLAPIFSPRSIAVVGASDREGSVSRAVMGNLAAFPGQVFPVNPKRAEVLGRRCFPSLGAIGQPVDLAVIITPATTVPALMADCVAAGVKGAVIISAGFKETGAQGAELEQQVLLAARRNGLRIIGPNCLGVMVPHAGLNATFAAQMAGAGTVAFLSQSGALCTAILDLSLRENVGFSAFVSVGSMLDVGWGDLVRHFGDDPHTHSIVMYLESVGDAQSFLCAAREVAAKKPIVVIKVGRTAAAARAAASHTGALTGSDAVLDAALRQAGVLRVDTIEELFDVAEVLSKQPLPRGPRLAIVTNAGGPGALAVDALVGRGGAVAELDGATLAKLDALLPPHWSHGDPVDVLGDADAERFACALKIVSQDDSVDGLLAVLTPQAMTDPTAVAEKIAPLAAEFGKPLLCSWMGGHAVRDGRRIMNAARIPTHDYPDEAARAFVSMWERRKRLEWLAETMRASARCTPAATSGGVDAIIANARASGRTLLSETEAKSVLKASGIPVVETFIATSEDEAVARAEQIGFPVVLKLHSATITHKSDVGGVKLNLHSADAVRTAWRDIAAAVRPADFAGVSVQKMIRGKGIELILGATTDPQFGPVLLFGAGGTLVEVLQDRALILPPVTREIALRWIAETKIHKALRGVRGQRAVDMDALADVLERFSAMVLAERSIVEADINPLVASPAGIVALDARIVLHDARDADAVPAAFCVC